MNEEQRKVFNYLKMIESYFRNNSDLFPLFIPEYEICSDINNLISSRNILTESDFEEIVSIYNRIVDVEHYNGTGWMDYQLRLGAFLRFSGYESDFSYITGKLNIHKKPGSNDF